MIIVLTVAVPLAPQGSRELRAQEDHRFSSFLLKMRIAGFSQRFQKSDMILLIVKNGLQAIPTIHHMADRPGILNSQLARHTRISTPSIRLLLFGNLGVMSQKCI